VRAVAVAFHSTPLHLLHPCHRRCADVDCAHVVDLLRVDEHPLGHGGLARDDVRDDPDIAVALQRVLALRCLAFGGLCLDHGGRHHHLYFVLAWLTAFTTCNG